MQLDCNMRNRLIESKGKKSGFSLLADYGLHPSQIVMVGFLCGNTAVDNIGFVDIVGNNMTSGIVLMIIRIGGGNQLDGQG